jgi:hypothetical protein
LDLKDLKDIQDLMAIKVLKENKGLLVIQALLVLMV